MCVCVCVCVCLYLNKLYFVRNYDFIYMIMEKLTMNWFWYPNQWGLFIGTLIPSQWGSFIGILIPKPMGIVHQYSDTQTNGDCSSVLWYPNQWGSFIGQFIGTLMPKPMGVVHWYSDTQSRGYSVTIVIRLLRIWITFEYLKCFESLKLHIWYWKCLSIWTILSH